MPLAILQVPVPNCWDYTISPLTVLTWSHLFVLSDWLPSSLDSNRFPKKIIRTKSPGLEDFISSNPGVISGVIGMKTSRFARSRSGNLSFPTDPWHPVADCRVRIPLTTWGSFILSWAVVVRELKDGNRILTGRMDGVFCILRASVDCSTGLMGDRSSIQNVTTQIGRRSL